MPAIEGIASPGFAIYAFASLQQLYQTLERVYKLGVSLPDVPLESFKKATAHLPRTTEAERLTIQRVGQSLFRDALLEYWNGRCPLTGITDTALLRASHIVTRAECETDELRLDVHNGLLLSALWDAAFDCGLISFADDGTSCVRRHSPVRLLRRLTSSPISRCSRSPTSTARTWAATALATDSRSPEWNSTQPSKLVSAANVLHVLSRLPRVTEGVCVTRKSTKKSDNTIYVN